MSGGWVVGIDAGGSGTRASAYRPDSGERRSGRAAGANWTVHGPDLCRERVQRAVSDALPEGDTPASLALCMAGYYPPDHGEAVREWAAATWPEGPFRVETDVLGAWA